MGAELRQEAKKKGLDKMSKHEVDAAVTAAGLPGYCAISWNML